MLRVTREEDKEWKKDALAQLHLAGVPGDIVRGGEERTLRGVFWASRNERLAWDRWMHALYA